MVMKLYYFDSRIIAEPTRLVLVYAKADWEDVRIPRDEWPAMKEKMPRGKVPVLEVDGKYLTESAAICRYVANKYGLAGNDSWEKAKVDELIDIQKEFYSNNAPYFYAKVGYHNPEKVDEFYESVAKSVIKQYLTMYTDLLEKNGTGFFVGKKETLIDFWISDYIYSLNKMAPELVKDFPKVLEHMKRVHELPQLKEYIASRKESLV
ncbi:hypothetical protein M3Y97_00911600 [Aphelenchoides bicaudatus]|nr:hypothetical protein M3Y97_00911600 [Aphelenchoides bicaudatus]